ncbi:keratin, type I cytoskeletal 18-like [Macaca thibetana thibetana]|uniref:keratin, type I cytoskeletal 18-like n=1 Tax=Macaca thibetana thibetana TaxID=257877 RepID=UPI0021BCBA4E|nr:keratin, type I cytoskeletal 18-like [Macaca thibetana thibetana]
MGSGGLAVGMVGGLAGMGGIQNEKKTMQSLNDCLASYLYRAKSLETKNQKLESKIWEHLEKKGPQVRDWSHYFKTIEDLRAQIFAMPALFCRSTMSVLLLMTLGSSMRQSWPWPVTSIGSARSLMTPVSLGHSWRRIEALKEEMLFMKKNHAEEVKGLQAQIASSGLTMEVDDPRSQDLAKIMADIWDQYDELAWKNQEELDKYWSQKNEESTKVVTTQSAKVGAAEMTLTELRHAVQSSDIDLDSMRNLKVSLEGSLREVEARHTLQMEQLNGVLLHLESELAQTLAEGQRRAQKYEALLNIKVKMEAEMATCHRLLEDGEEFNLGDALDSNNSMQTIQKTTTHQTVDGKVLSEMKDTKVLRH